VVAVVEGVVVTVAVETAATNLYDFGTDNFRRRMLSKQSSIPEYANLKYLLGRLPPNSKSSAMR